MGGALINHLGGTATVSNATFVQNRATGGTGAAGGNGGDAQGGGIHNGAGSTFTLLRSTVVNNRADGGAAGSGGSAGLGQGGGIANLGTLCVDLATNITGNHASTSDDDVFGVICVI